MSALAVVAAAAEPDTAPQLGDLVFKPAGTAMWTQAAAYYSRGDTRWGHVGVVAAFEQGEPIIVHADMGPPKQTGHVRADPLRRFRGQAASLALFRLPLEDTQRERLAAYALDLAKAELPFDRHYRLDSEDSMYCTELVWRAWTVATGEDPIPVKSLNLGKPYIALSDLSLHPEVREIGPLEAAQPLKH